MTFEEKLEKLKQIVEKMETPDTLELDASLELFEEGVSLVRSCREILEKAELRIQKVSDTEHENDAENESDIMETVFEDG